MLLKPVLILIGQPTAYAVDDHKDCGRRKDAPYDDQQKFHASNLKGQQRIGTPAGLGRHKSAKVATNGPIRRGIFAHVPLRGRAAMVSASYKEDAPWMNSAIPEQTPQAAAESVSLWPLSLSLLSCFTRFSQAADLPQPLIQRRWAQRTKAPLCLKKLRRHNRSPQLWANRANTTHATTTKGGRSNAFALAALIAMARKTSVCRLTHTLMTKGSPC